MVISGFLQMTKFITISLLAKIAISDRKIFCQNEKCSLDVCITYCKTVRIDIDDVRTLSNRKLSTIVSN